MIYRLKLHSLAYISAAESIGLFSTTFKSSAPKATEFGEIKRRLGLLHRSRSSKVTETSRHTNSTTYQTATSSSAIADTSLHLQGGLVWPKMEEDILQTI